MATVLMAAGCSGTDDVLPDTPDGVDDDFMHFRLDFPVHTSAEPEVTGSNLDPLTNYLNKEESVLLISQRTQDHSISFEDFIGSSTNAYLFKYVWDGTEAESVESGMAPNWESGYNFFPMEGWGNMLNWTAAIRNGAFGSSYAFGALYYPVENEQRTAVEPDQTTLEGLGKSNVLGAYHLTESLYERFRFRLYHLMACIRVSILIPEERTDAETGTTGFPERTVNATALGLQRDFVIDWGARSSEEPPILKADETLATRSNINMFAHPVAGTRETEEIDLTNFSLEGSDKVRRYTFTVVFPAQTLSNTDNILQFDIMNQRGTRVESTYYWSTSQLMNNLQVSPGTITNLILYLPREENNALLIRSEIIDWNHTDASVTVVPEK